VVNSGFVMSQMPSHHARDPGELVGAVIYGCCYKRSCTPHLQLGSGRPVIVRRT
jgi:hypothetical protein